MIIATIMLLAVFFASLYFITRPLFSYDLDDYEIEKSEEIDRETIFLTLNELEFDFKSGKLSKNDYERLNTKYKMLATSVLKKEEDNLLIKNSPGKIPDDAILRKAEAAAEKEIAQFIKQSKMEKE